MTQKAKKTVLVKPSMGVIGHRRLWKQSTSAFSGAYFPPTEIMKLRSARRIAEVLKQAAKNDKKRNIDAYRLARSMLTYELKRAGKRISPARRALFEGAKAELRKAFGLKSLRS